MSRWQGGGGYGRQGDRGRGGYRDQGGRDAAQAPSKPPVFDPAKDYAELVDQMAEEQANLITQINSSQLRRFFGEAKDLYRRLHTGAGTAEEREQLYKKSIEPQFRMMRSKASYAYRNGQGSQSKIPRSFHDFIENGVKKTRNSDDFSKFIQHFEAVVGFIYGKGLASGS